MADSDTTAQAGKGKRVAGTFLLMLGAGIVLESPLQGVGSAILLAGAAFLVRGLLNARPHAAHAPATVQVAPVSIDPQTEGRL